MSRIVTVSNRLPITVKRKGQGYHIDQSSGGLVTGLQSLQKSHDLLWVGWPGISTEKIIGDKENLTNDLRRRSLYPVYLTGKDITNYYNGFCNATLWPLLHYFPLEAIFKAEWWKRYQNVNQLFSEIVANIMHESDLVWIHDYHLFLLPAMLREKTPKATIGFFLHTPFPAYEIFRLIPWRKELLQGITGADVIGFHTHEYMAHFLESIFMLCGYDSTLGQINTGERMIKVDAFPISIDYDKFSLASSDDTVINISNRYRSKFHGYRIILSVDRLDYTKGIIQRLESYDQFLKTNPQYIGKVIFILLVVPSRTKVERYRKLKRQLDEMVGEINGRYSSIEWSPIWYLYCSLPFNSLVALYKVADVALVTPRRDGMNLVAKEYIATKTEKRGVLIISETAGASKEMGEAIIVNPNNIDEIVKALEDALNMSDEEQVTRNEIMQQRLKHNDIRKWADSFVLSLEEMGKTQAEMNARFINAHIRQNLLAEYKNGQKRLILLDYDGTLTSFKDMPDLAEPNSELIDLLIELAEENKNDVVLISGRDRSSLHKWFGGTNINLVAEHGGWIRKRGEDWGNIEPIAHDWKGVISSVLETWSERTPGSFIEEKDFSLAWHYRKVDPKLSELRLKDVLSELLCLIANLNLQILRGNKVIEVRNAHINKGRTVSIWLSAGEYDFILAIGDDYTDEDMFAVLPETAWTFKVGLGISKAKYNIRSPAEVQELLKGLIKSSANEKT